MNIFRAQNYKMELGVKSYVMGVLNVTPDSFSDGGNWYNTDLAIKRAFEIQAQGADILDIGAQSTRPEFTKISSSEELKRLIPVLEGIKGKLRIPISVDTFYPEVAAEALGLGADIINDVTGFKNDDMLRTVSESDCGIIIMHNYGKIGDIVKFFQIQKEKANKFGIHSNRICFDPGIGFGKTYEENLFILRNLPKFKIKDNALLIGASRKRVIGRSCGNPPFKDRVAGTIAAHSVALFNGADIVRVHDVVEGVQAAKVISKINNIKLQN